MKPNEVDLDQCTPAQLLHTALGPLDESLDEASDTLVVIRSQIQQLETKKAEIQHRYDAIEAQRRHFVEAIGILEDDMGDGDQ